MTSTGSWRLATPSYALAPGLRRIVCRARDDMRMIQLLGRGVLPAALRAAVLAAAAGISVAGATPPARATTPLGDPPLVSATNAALQASVSVTVTYNDDSPAGTAYLYAAGGTGRLGLFTAASLRENDDGQALRQAASVISAGEDADSTGETTILTARFRCIEQGLVYFVLTFVQDQGGILSTAASVLGCGVLPPTPPPSSPAQPPPPFSPPAEFGQSSLTAAAGPSGQTFTLTATYRDDSPAGVAIVNLTYPTSGAARFTAASLQVNNDGQTVRVASGSISISEDADAVAESTTLRATLACAAPGAVSVSLTFIADDGRLYGRNTQFDCGGATPAIAPAPQPCPPAPPAATGPCVPPAAVACSPANATRPASGPSPIVCAIRPPSTGDGGLIRTSSLETEG